MVPMTDQPDTPEDQGPDRFIAPIREVMERLDNAVRAADTAEAYLLAHHETVRAIRLIRAYQDDFEQRAIKVWPEGQKRIVSIDRIGSFRVGRRANRTSWDLRKASHAVVDAAMETGNILNPRDVADVLIGAMTGSPGFRLETLKALNLNPDEFRAVDPGELKIEAV